MSSSSTPSSPSRFSACDETALSGSFNTLHPTLLCFFSYPAKALRRAERLHGETIQTYEGKKMEIRVLYEKSRRTQKIK